jgi:hypothetical protein
VTAYELGRLVGLLFLPLASIGVGVWLAVRRKRPGRDSWWLPLAVALPVALLFLIAPVVSRLADIPRELAPEEALVPLRDFRYVEDPAIQRADQERFRSDPAIGENVTDVAVRRISNERGYVVAVLQVLALDPAAAADLDPQEFARGVAEAAAGEITEETLEGQPVVVVMTAERALLFVLWPHENLFMVLTSRSESGGRRIASEMICGLGP